MKLWEKESNRPNALLVDIFDLRYFCPISELELTSSALDFSRNLIFNLHTYQHRKSDTDAVKERNAGNLLFAREKYPGAMQLYNKSLCLSEIKSDNISLAYANRSSCFFHMKMFDKCLVDIDLAITAGYPENKMKKLEKRRIDAGKAIKGGLLVQAHKPKLSFPPNEKVPVLANAIQMQKDSKLGQRFIAAKNLRVGQTIYLEPCFVGEAHAGKYATCNICHNYNECLVPCGKCSVAMFCANKCEKNELHKFECGIVPHSSEDYFMLLVRSIFLAVQMFRSVDALIGFVEETMANRSQEIADFTNPKSKYRAFLMSKCQHFSENSVLILKLYYKMMMDNAEMAKIFNTKKHQRFLMHLIIQHVSILKAGTLDQRMQIIISPNISTTVKLEMQMVILQSSFKISCVPNMTLTFSNGAVTGIVVRPIKQGQEITVNYIDNDYKKPCKCELCELPLSVIPRNPILQRDLDFVVISLNISRCRNEYTDQVREKLKAVCVSFLERYGSGQWCKEIDIVMAHYRELLTYCAAYEDFLNGIEQVA